MTPRTKLLTLREMQPIAREATRQALATYKGCPELENKSLTLGERIEGSEGVFELYLAGERPEDAKVISCARVDRRTGAVKVEVFLRKGEAIELELRPSEIMLQRMTDHSFDRDRIAHYVSSVLNSTFTPSERRRGRSGGAALGIGCGSDPERSDRFRIHSKRCRSWSTQRTSLGVRFTTRCAQRRSNKCDRHHRRSVRPRAGRWAWRHHSPAGPPDRPHREHGA